MTKNGFFKTLKLRLVLCLTILCLMFSFACAFSACGDEDEGESISYPSASKTEDDEALVKNGSFEYGSYNLTSSSFPVTSITGWSISNDNNAQSSNITGLSRGGVVDKDSWDTTTKKFYDSTSFKTVLKNYYNFEVTKETKLVDFENKIGFKKDKVFGDKNDNRVLMLNAYNSSLGGSAVKATSSNAITLDKDSYYQISVDVYTTNLSFNSEEGANIRIINKINGTSQAEAGIYGIVSEGAWTTYTIYVKSDAELPCSITLALGLGRGGDNANMVGTNVQGTAFFDNAVIEKIDKTALINELKMIVDNDKDSRVDFGGEDSMMQKYDGSSKYLYNMRVKVTDTPESFSDRKSGTLAPQSYKFLSFSLAKDDNTKPMFSEHDIYGATVYLLDKDNYDEVKNKTEIKKFTYNKEEDYTCKILLKNNFTNDTHSYQIEIVVGPTDGSTYLQQEANVDINAIEISSREGTLDEDSADYMYDLVSSIADKTVSLYAGYSQDYSEPKKDTYSFNVAKYDEINETTPVPVAVDGYKGVTTKSNYLTNKYSDNVEFNTKITDGTAGLVNSEFSSFYDNVSIPDAYEITNGNNYIQPLFIKNTNELAYGFIGEQKTINASSYATVSLKVYVDNSAKAYIYIIDTDTMLPMVFTDNNGTEHKLIITLADTNGKWVDVNFYIATGATPKNFRVELWNGARDGGETLVSGTVFFDNIAISTSASNFESERYEDMFATGTLGKLLDGTNQKFNEEDKILYTRKLTETEVEFNKEYPDKKVSYRQNYIWAKSESTVYAVYNTIDPIEVDPYANIEEESTSSGCGGADSSTFWLSFSSILLIVALVVALIALILKRLIIKRKKNASDAKSHYKVTSRYNAKKNATKAEEKEEISETTEQVEETKTEEEKEESTEEITETTEEPTEEPTEQVEEQKLDDYVYGDVQNFGEDLVTNEEQPSDDVPAVEEVTEVNEDKPSDDVPTVEEVTEVNEEQPTESENSSEEKPE